ncbi:hypothetical protein GCM10010360_51600 [Streptomyces nogalater]
MASSSGRSWATSCRLPPVSVTVSGRQQRSHPLPQVVRNKISTRLDALPTKIVGRDQSGGRGVRGRGVRPGGAYRGGACGGRFRGHGAGPSAAQGLPLRVPDGPA